MDDEFQMWLKEEYKPNRNSMRQKYGTPVQVFCYEQGSELRDTEHSVHDIVFENYSHSDTYHCSMITLLGCPDAVVKYMREWLVGICRDRFSGPAELKRKFVGFVGGESALNFEGVFPIEIKGRSVKLSYDRLQECLNG